MPSVPTPPLRSTIHMSGFLQMLEVLLTLSEHHVDPCRRRQIQAAVHAFSMNSRTGSGFVGSSFFLSPLPPHPCSSFVTGRGGSCSFFCVLAAHSLRVFLSAA